MQQQQQMAAYQIRGESHSNGAARSGWRRREFGDQCGRVREFGDQGRRMREFGNQGWRMREF